MDGKSLRRQREKKRTLGETWLRVFRYRLVVPVLRSRHPPEHSARGALIGLAWAMTPLVGVQMYLCLMTWIVAKKLFKWNFSLPIACAWTWVTNVFTMIPTYYVFYLTGHVMMGFRRRPSEYGRFMRIFKSSFADDAGLLASLKASFAALFKDWGLAMSVGCLPWMILIAWLGYNYTLKFTLARRARLEKRNGGSRA